MAEKFDNLEEHLEKFVENIRQLGIIVSDFQPSSQTGLNQKLWVRRAEPLKYHYSAVKQWTSQLGVNLVHWISETSWSPACRTSRSAASSSMRSTCLWRPLSESGCISDRVLLSERSRQSSSPLISAVSHHRCLTAGRMTEHHTAARLCLSASYGEAHAVLRSKNLTI